MEEEVVKVETPEGTIQKFLNQDLQALIDRAVLTIPGNKRIALIAHARVENNTVVPKLAVVMKLTSGWSAMGILEKPWKKPLVGEFAIARAW